MKNIKNLFLTTLFFPVLGFAQTNPLVNKPTSALRVGLDSMFANFANSATAITTLVQYSAYLIGLFLVINSIFKFSELGKNQQLTPKTPIIMFLSGVFLFGLTASISVISQTMVMGPGPGAVLMPTQAGLGTVTASGLYGVKLFIRLVGYIAFIRGWLLINQSGQGKEGTLGRGLTHLFGGVAAINIDITGKILMNTFAPGMSSVF